LGIRQGRPQSAAKATPAQERCKGISEAEKQRSERWTQNCTAGRAMKPVNDNSRVRGAAVEGAANRQNSWQESRQTDDSTPDPLAGWHKLARTVKAKPAWKWKRGRYAK